MARRRGERDRVKERFWREKVRQWRRSGGTIRDFCAEHHLSEPSFYAWRREIAKRDEQTGERAARTNARSARRHANDLPAFVPVRVTSSAPASALEVVVGAGQVVRVTPGFDAPTLRALLAILAEAPAC